MIGDLACVLYFDMQADMWIADGWMDRYRRCVFSSSTSRFPILALDTHPTPPVPFIDSRNAMMLRHNPASINTLHDRKALCFDRFPCDDVECQLSYPRSLRNAWDPLRYLMFLYLLWHRELFLISKIWQRISLSELGD